MSLSSQSTLDAYFNDLREALGSAHAPAVNEIRADAEGRIESAVRAGTTRAAATAAVLEDLGNPFELAHHIGETRAPMGGRILTWTKAVLFTVAVVWTGLLCFGIRSMSIGFDGTVMLLICAGFHAPFLLLLAPKLVWRRNWLFVPIVTVAVATVLLLLPAMGQGGTNSAGTESSTRERMPDDERIRRNLILALGFAGVSGLLLMTLQQSRQRMLVVFGLGGVVAVPESVHRVAEARLQQNLDRAVAMAEEHKGPWDDALQERITSQCGDLELCGNPEGICFFFGHPLAPGNEVWYFANTRRYEVGD